MANKLLGLEIEGVQVVDKVGPFLYSFSGVEHVSRLFTFDLEVIWGNEEVEPAELIGKKVGVSIAHGSQPPRWFSGHISRFVACGQREDYRVYRVQMVPWLWFLTQTSDCKIFDRGPRKRNPTPIDVLKEVFGSVEFPPERPYDLDRAQGPHRSLEYCVQYRETDFNFVSRIMEQYGYYYWFEHTQSSHKLILGDSTDAYGECKTFEVKLAGTTKGDAPDSDQITSWEHQYQFVPGAFSHTDYSFKDATTSLESPVPGKTPLQVNKSFEIFDFPGEFFDKGRGDAEGKLRIEEEEAGFDVVQGSSNSRHFQAGCRLKLAGHYYDKENGEYVLTSVHHYAAEPGAHLTGDVGRATYSNTFTCLPAKVVARPQRVTPKPVISGVQTAVVVGPKGEEIFTDPSGRGRVLVHFHWDREGRKDRDDKVAAWIRVAQPIAGKGWGFMAIPRIGQEVIVEFVEGDPDRPLITGCVYNSDQPIHSGYALPDHKTKIYLKTNSSKGGDGHNELMFDDKANEEQLYMHAQKNMDVRVRNDSKERIYGHRHQIIGWEKDGQKGGDQRELVYQDKQLNIKRHQIEHIEGNYQIMIGAGEASDGGNLAAVIEKQVQIAIGQNGVSVLNEGSQREEVKGTVSSTVGGDRKEEISGSRSLAVKVDHKQKVGGGVSLEAGGDLHEKVGGSTALEAGQNIHIKAGMSLVLEAGMQLTLKVGGNFVTIGPSGVDIMGTLVNINTAGAPGSGSGASPKAPDKPDAPDTDVPKAKPTKPAQALTSKTGAKSAPG